MQQDTWTGTTHYETETAGLVQIELEFSDADLTVLPSSAGRLVITQTDGRSSRLFHVERSGETLRAADVKKCTLWPLERRHLSVLLPAAYNGSLTLSLSSGRINVGGLNLHQLHCMMRSAGLQITGCRTAAITVRAQSGSIELANIDSGTVELSCGSGGICCENVVCTSFASCTRSGPQRLGVHASKSCSLRALSGSVHFTGSTPYLETETKSGTQRLQVDGLEQARLQAVSGGLEMTVPEGPELRRIDLWVVSGGGRLMLPAQITPLVDFQSASGGCRVHQADFAADGPHVRVYAHIVSGGLQIAPAMSA